MDWKQWLAYITASVDQELLLRNEHLFNENRILRQQIRGCVRLSDAALIADGLTAFGLAIGELRTTRGLCV